mmetsp:Transcript_43181/g.91855  ORF Transcript_43181/g.91855 Transcript_43181/m.91855 type:complete len:346 (-) Transcript_43181:185-1222(-)|eukprot:CAMPEP_0172530226 /NCGR_PEP_ID=MMETSP1067-20121228/4022_1 /TAXON_ID=265564 ORGANISM="Thalassiosira punctigera, Strain Tpunct2005C2" /NCGR_SAMPLE_ID=MMETSP1067 /ASSEMBLY_ACC=CAM_ASM_000444 /LENGTH=345 /DNA_ID=CAMNT_0013314387 /DNA_START=83 /DNA_END=1120 /DNA_ORIENTATION=+
MTKFSAGSLALLSALASAFDGVAAAEVSDQENNFDVDISMEVSEDCDYELAVSFAHDADLPLGSKDKCDPANVQIAPEDGKPYLAFREFDHAFSDEIYEATGFASISLDWQACGHPPVNVFTVPHYDFHFYTDPAEIRAERTCDQPEGAPICIPDVKAQTTASGRAFFSVATVWQLVDDVNSATNAPANMPPGFTCGLADAIPLSGTHCWDLSSQPADVASWINPFLILGSYDSKIAFFEPMAPVSFVTGSGTNSHSEKLVYEGQTVHTLPHEWSMMYNSNTNRTTVTLKGKSGVCGEEAEVTPVEGTNSTMNSTTNSTEESSSVFRSCSGLVSAGIAVLAMALF